MPDEKLTGAINATDLPALVAELYPESGAEPGKGDTVQAVWREEENASFSLYRAKSGAWLFRDHATNETGNAYHFLTRILKWSPRKAAETLFDVAGDFEAMPLDLEERTGPQACPAVPVPPALREAHKQRFVRTIKNRSVPPALQERGFTIEDVKALGIAEQRGDAYFPVLGPDGTLLNIKRRKSQPEHKNDRYRGLAGHGSPAWCSPNMAEAHADTVIVVEGELNAMALSRVFQDQPQYAFMGVAGANMHLHLEALRGRTVYTYADDDDAGREAKRRWAHEAVGVEAEDVYVCPPLPGGLDACDTMAQYGREELAARFEVALGDAHHVPQGNGSNGDVDLFLYERNEVGDTERVRALHGPNILYTPQLGFMYYDNTEMGQNRWITDMGTAYVDSLVVDTYTRLQEEAGKLDKDERKVWTKYALNRKNDGPIRRIVNRLKHVPNSTASLGSFDRDPMLLHVRNGTIDLRTGKLREPSREDMITKMAPVTYDPDAPPPEKWLEFQRQICGGDEELLRFKQRALGYSLTGNTDEECLFIAYGKGANGKSTEQHVIGAILGDYASTTQFSTFTPQRNEGPRTDIARLSGARFVRASEGSATHQLDEGLVKQTTGQDPVVARFLYRAEFEFVPQWKIWLATNHKPTIKGVDEGIWRRIKLLPYTFTIPPEQRDRRLRERLMEERQGILNWLIEGCLLWQEHGLGEAASVAQAVHEYQRESDVLAYFIEECCELGEGFSVPVRDLFRTYQTWARANGIQKPYPMQSFSKMLTERGFEWSKQRPSVPGQKRKGKVAAVRVGLRLSSEGENLAAGLDVEL